MKKVITTFCGCGGSSLGYQRAGLKVILANDWEERAIQTYKMNFPKTPTYLEDIRELTGKKILTLTGLKKGELDILDGSPPCTPFSISGPRQKRWNDTDLKHTGDTKPQQTKDLFFEFIRLVQELEPKVFIAENVKGMIIGKVKGYFNSILAAMENIGKYDVQVLLLNSKHFEVPQTRERIFFIGIRKDVVNNKEIKIKKHPQIIWKEAMKGLVIPESELADLHLGPQHDGFKFWNLAKQGTSFQEVDPKGYRFNTMKLSESKVPCTLTAQAHLYFHPTERRQITIAEMKRIQTFPDDFKFISRNDGRIRIGNSVPPNLIKNVALYILDKTDNIKLITRG